MAANDKKRKGSSYKKNQDRRKAMGYERTNKAKRLIKQVRLFPDDKQACRALQVKLSEGDVPSALKSKALDALDVASKAVEPGVL